MLASRSLTRLPRGHVAVASARALARANMLFLAGSRRVCESIDGEREEKKTNGARARGCWSAEKPLPLVGGKLRARVDERAKQ